MTQKHTPEPWYWSRKDGPQWFLAPGILVVEGGMTDGTPDGDAMDRANARLIAAAPELLEALQLADAALMGANMDMKSVERKVYAAIAKATGAE